MKKFFLSGGLIVVFAIYAFRQSLVARFSPALEPIQPGITVSNAPTNTPIASEPAPASSAPSSAPQPTLKPTPKPAPTPVPTPTPAPQGKFKDGTYVGNSADAYYGLVKVQVVVQNGKIADVIFLDHPGDRRTSIEINTQAMPMLKSEALQAQSASVNTISGATETSGAFRESLGNALSQAI